MNRVVDLQEPFLQGDNKEGGTSLNDAGSGSELYMQQAVGMERLSKPKEYEGVPKQMPIEDRDFKEILKNDGNHLTRKQLKHEFLVQGQFNFQTETYENHLDLTIKSNNLSVDNGEHNQFDIDQLSQFVDGEIITMDLDPKIRAKPELLRQESKKEAFNEVLNYEQKEEIKPFDDDISRDENLINVYTNEFREQIQKHKIIFSGENGETDIQIQELRHQILNEKIEPQISIHKSLISSGNLDSNIKLFELRKHLYPESVENKNIGTLKLELACINPSDKSSKVGQIVLNKFQGNEAAELFNSNFECLFGHLQVRNKLYFFTIEEEVDEHLIQLQKFEIKDGAYLNQNNIDTVFNIKLDQSSINVDIPEGKLLGATILPNLNENMSYGNHDGKYPNFYFAIIIGRSDEHPQLQFDVRHSSKPEMTIKKEIQRVSADSFKQREPVIVQLCANKMLYQMLLTGQINKEAMNDINREILKKQQAKNYAMVQHRVKHLFEQKAPGSKEFDKDKIWKNPNELSMFVIGSISQPVFDQVTEFFIINRDSLIVEYQKEDLKMKSHDIKIKEMLVESLRMLSLRNTCNIVKFNSQDEELEISYKYLCRGQIELIKRLLIEENILFSDSQAPIDQSVSNFISKSIYDANVKNFSRMRSGIQEKQANDFKNIQEKISKYACTSLIDTVNRQMHMLIYHSEVPNNQFFLTINLSIFSQVTKQLISSEQEDKNLSKKLKLNGYNQLFMEIFKAKNDQVSIDQMKQKFIITRRFDNLARDIQNIYWLRNRNNQKQLKISKDETNKMTSLKNRFQMFFGQNDQAFNFMETQENKHQFIYSIINDNNQQIEGKNNDFKFDVKSFHNFTNSKPRHLTESQSHQITDIEPQNIKFSLPGPVNRSTLSEFNMDDKYIILQNVFTVEDDREDIPIVSIGKDFKGMQFAIMQYEQIRAITSLFIDRDKIIKSIDKQILHDQSNYQNIVQFCASSEVLEGQDMNNRFYMFQNYTIAIFFQNQMRFVMQEYQVKWRPNLSQNTPTDQPYQIEINMIKLREVILKKCFETEHIKEFLLVPLYDKIESVSEVSKQIDQKETASYQITGVQLLLELQSGAKCFLDFRSLMDKDLYRVKDQLQEITFKQKLVYSRAKLIEQHHLNGVYVETQFKHQREGDLTSDLVNSGIFDIQQSFDLLEEANFNALNSIPIDFIALMDVPEIIDEWFQISKKSQNQQLQQSIRVQLTTDDLFHNNYKRYFGPCELNKGFQLFESFALEDQKNKQPNNQTNHLFQSLDPRKKTYKKRDPYKIKMLFKNLNLQQQDYFWDFKCIKDHLFPDFALSLIERVLKNDESVIRFNTFRQYGLLMDGRDVLTSNLNHDSILQQPLERHDDVMVDIYVQQLFDYNQYSDNKYSQFMRSLPMIIEHDCMASSSSSYFQFFKDSDQFLVIDEPETSSKQFNETIFGKENASQESIDQLKMIQLNQYMPAYMQDQIDRYTNKKLQVFIEDSKKNLKNLNYNDPMRQAYNLMHEYESQGSEFEVLASMVNIKPYILGKKLIALNQAKSVDDLQKVNYINFDDYELALLLRKVQLMTKGNIDDQKIIRDLIDWQYSGTSSFLYKTLFVYVVFYCIPLILQMASTNGNMNFYMNSSCLVVQSILLVYELITLYELGPLQYFQSILNWMDLLNVISYIFYWAERMKHIDSDLIPLIPQNLEGKEQEIKEYLKKDSEHDFKMNCPYFHTVLILFGFIKLLYFLRCNQQFGELVQLVMSCCYDVKIFIMFFFSWVAVFQTLFKVTGVNIPNEDYPLIPQLSYLLQTFRNTVGDIAPPSYEYWKDLEEMHKQNSPGHKYMMKIYLIWILWFSNQFLNSIILLNFLIAIVSQSYDRVISNRLIHVYEHKSELNIEIQRFKDFFKSRYNFDVISIVSDHMDDIKNQDQITGLTHTMRIFMKDQISKLQEDISKRFTRNETQAATYELSLKQYFNDRIKSQMETVMNHLQIIEANSSNLVSMQNIAADNSSLNDKLSNLINIVQKNGNLIMEEQKERKEAYEAMQKEHKEALLDMKNEQKEVQKAMINEIQELLKQKHEETQELFQKQINQQQAQIEEIKLIAAKNADAGQGTV